MEIKRKKRVAMVNRTFSIAALPFVSNSLNLYEYPFDEIHLNQIRD
jgi:hypothetical protein